MDDKILTKYNKELKVSVYDRYDTSKMVLIPLKKPKLYLGLNEHRFEFYSPHEKDIKSFVLLSDVKQYIDSQ